MTKFRDLSKPSKLILSISICLKFCDYDLAFKDQHKVIYKIFTIMNSAYVNYI